MQCPLMKYSCCCFSLKGFLLMVSIVGVGLGVYSMVAPRRSIALYAWIMERFNWKVSPIDMAKEERNTVYLGGLLAALSVLLFVTAGMKY
ncbi:MAG: hypothetical protein KTQ49_02775 [Candidatus Omnitrophica bacterium]|nr:hypothetical protein [Candidatus Omnitrophota bacterium]